MTVMPPSHTNRLDPLPPHLDTIWTSDGGLKLRYYITLTPHIFPIKNGISEDLTESYRRDLVESSRRYSIHIWTVSGGKGFGE
jgi:hypothetical protein